MNKGWKKCLLLGGLAGLLAGAAGCYGYGSYGGMTRRVVPKTTAAKESLEEFDISLLRREDGAFQYADMAWGTSMEDMSEYFGVPIETASTFADGSSYADVNYCILLLDKISVGLMPTFDENGGVNCVSFNFEQVYTAEELDTFYSDLVKLCESEFGKADEVRPEERENGNTTYKCETTFWFHEVSETEMTTLQVGKLDSGRGTEAVILGINDYDPTEVVEETSEGESEEQSGSEEASEDEETGEEKETVESK